MVRPNRCGFDELRHGFGGINVAHSDDKRRARLNIISHLLETVPHHDVPHEAVKLPSRQERAYTRPPIDSQTWVPQRYVVR